MERGVFVKGWWGTSLANDGPWKELSGELVKSISD